VPDRTPLAVRIGMTVAVLVLVAAAGTVVGNSVTSLVAATVLGMPIGLVAGAALAWLWFW
jgi:hypothetical protein